MSAPNTFKVKATEWKGAFLGILQVNSSKYKKYKNHLYPTLDAVLPPAKRENKIFQLVQIILWSIMSCTASSRVTKKPRVFKVIKKEGVEVSIYFSPVSHWSSSWTQVSLPLASSRSSEPHEDMTAPLDDLIFDFPATIRWLFFPPRLRNPLLLFKIWNICQKRSIILAITKDASDLIARALVYE